MWWLSMVTLAAVVSYAQAHGRVIDPPSRASAWRFGFNTAPNYDDDGLNCGGFAMQWSVNGGRCGICGDPYHVPPPRPHELGGVYGQGVIVGKYQSGSILTTTVDLTTSHRGFWEFKLCPDPENNEQRCFDRHVLELEGGGTKYYPNEGSKKYTVSYRLPKGMVCDHCVLQWRYTAGNNWGDCKNGTQALGCGNQEQFGACSDISIGVTKSLPLALKEQNKYNEIPYPLFYYLKHGYFDSEQGHRGTSSIPHQQSLTNHDRKKPQTHNKKKPKPPHLKPSNRPSNSHQNQKVYQIQQPGSQKKQQPQYSQEYTLQFEKYTQPTEKYAQPTQKYAQPTQKYAQPTEKYAQSYSQKYTQSTERNEWDPDNFFDNENHWQSHLEPAFFEFNQHKKPSRLKSSHRKPRLRKKSKKKSRWPKLFYGIWR